jgi:cytochrome c-type biogenesis protein CcmH/NrfG
MPRDRILEIIMRFAAPAVALTLLLATTSSVSFGKRQADDQISPQATAMTQMAAKEAAAGRFDQAIDAYEGSLLIDPRNRAAYIGLAQVARKQNLPGKAIRLYREALTIEPNDVVALSGQGEALVEKGAVTKAKENLARIERLCASSCVERQKLAAVIAKGAPAPKPLAAEAVVPKPVVQETPQ